MSVMETGYGQNDEAFAISFLANRQTAADWEQLKERHALTDSQVPQFLLKWYKDAQKTCAYCFGALAHFCPACYSLTPHSQIPAPVAPDPMVVAKTSPKHFPSTDQSAFSYSTAAPSNSFYDGTVTNYSTADYATASSSAVTANNSTVDYSETKMEPEDDAPMSPDEDNDGTQPIDNFNFAIATCIWCDKDFASIDELKSHLIEHSSEKWQLEHAPKRFKRRYKRHKRPYVRKNLPKRKTRASSGVEKKPEDDGSDSTIDMTDQKYQSLSAKKKSSSYEEPRDSKKFLTTSTLNGSGKTRVVCLYCDKKLKGPVYLSVHHFRIHLKTHPFKCYSCQETFATISHLMVHQREMSHDSLEVDGVGKPRPYRCAVCGVSYLKLGSLIRHGKEHTSADIFKCQLCFLCFPSESELIGHKCVIGGSKAVLGNSNLQNYPLMNLPFKGQAQSSSVSASSSQSSQFQNQNLADVSGPQISYKPYHTIPQDHAGSINQSDLELSQQNAENKKFPQPDAGSTQNITDNKDDVQTSETKADVKKPVFQCPHCSASFKTQGSLKNHMQRHTGQNAYPCTECDESFSNLRKLTDHQTQVHWSALSMTCRECNKGFRTVKGLQTHMVLHTKQFPFQCKTCGAGFGTKASCQRHEKTLHQGLYQFQCCHCPSKFSSASNYQRHMQEHLDSKEHLCPICGTTFPNDFRLKSHIITHGKKNFVCEQCGKAFHHKGDYKKHKARHLEFRPFKCPVCDKGFLAKHLLEIHNNRVHLGLKPYKCDECDAAFAVPYRLKEHKRAAHTDELPYVCTVCGKAYAKSFDRRLHEKMVHKLHQPAPRYTSIVNPPRAPMYTTPSSIVNHEQAPTFTTPSSVINHEQAPTFTTPSSVVNHEQAPTFTTPSVINHEQAPTFTTPSNVINCEQAPTFTTPSSIVNHEQAPTYTTPITIINHEQAPTFTTPGSIVNHEQAPTFTTPGSIVNHEQAPMYIYHSQ